MSLIPQLHWWQWAMLLLAFFIVPTLLRKIAIYGKLGRAPTTATERSVIGDYGLVLAVVGGSFGLVGLVSSGTHPGATLFVGGIALASVLYLWDPMKAVHGSAYGTYLVGSFVTANIETIALSVSVVFLVSVVICGCARWRYADMWAFTTGAVYVSTLLTLATLGYVLPALAAVGAVVGGTALTRRGYVETALTRVREVSVS